MSETSDVTWPLIDKLNSGLFPGVRATRVHCGKAPVRGGYMKNNPKGWPDIHVTYRVYGMFIETKRPGGKLSKEQHEFIEAATRDGIRVRCAETVRDGIEHVQEFLREVGR